jgi:hypothetical protein
VQEKGQVTPNRCRDSSTWRCQNEQSTPRNAEKKTYMKQYN